MRADRRNSSRTAPQVGKPGRAAGEAEVPGVGGASDLWTPRPEPPARAEPGKSPLSPARPLLPLPEPGICFLGVWGSKAVLRPTFYPIIRGEFGGDLGKRRLGICRPFPAARQDRGSGNVPEVSQQRIRAPVSVTAPGHGRGSPTRPVLAFLAPKSKCRDGREFFNPAPLQLLLSLLYGGGKQGDFGASQVCYEGVVPPGLSHPPPRRREKGFSHRKCKVNLFLWGNACILHFSAPITLIFLLTPAK